MTMNSTVGDAAPDSDGTGDGSPSGIASERDHRPRLLVVDDQEDSRELLARRLERNGFDVCTASDGQAALALLSRQAYDLILLDVCMPGMDGREVLQRVRSLHSINELPVVMVSALTESQTVIEALELGANDYVTEPVDFDVALARIHNQLRTSAAARASARPSEPPAGRVEVGSVIDGRYRLEAVIGTGGFAKVYRATQLSTGQPVAVKVLRAGHGQDAEQATALRRRFELEMRLIGELSHPNVVRLLDSGTVLASQRTSLAPPGGSGIATRGAAAQGESTGARHVAVDDQDERLPFLVMELLQGETLDSKLKREGPLRLEETISLMLPVMSGVGSAHARGAIHRDLKPANVFIANEGGERLPKVLDFGIAKLIDHTTTGRSLTQTAALIGTPEYMAPEQTCGKNVDARCDQFTAASVLFECLTGRRAFEGKSVIDIVRRVYQGEFPELPDSTEVPASFREAMRRASAVDPDDRFPSIEHFALALLEGASDQVRSRWEPSLRQATERTGRISETKLRPGAAEDPETADTMEIRSRHREDQ